MAALALGGPRLLGVPARNPGGPQPRVPGPAGGGVLLKARPALAALGRGRNLPALRAQAPGDALGGAVVVAREVAGPLLLGATAALAAMGLGRALSTLQAQALRAALGGPAVIALQVPPAPGGGVGIAHGAFSVAKSESK